MDVSVATNERLFSTSNAEAEHEKMVAESGLSPSEWNHAMEEVRFFVKNSKYDLTKNIVLKISVEKHSKPYELNQNPY